MYSGSNTSAVRGIAAPQPNALPQDTLTSKAVRIEEKARMVRNRVEEIASRLIPREQESGRGPESPPPSHAVFALESAEQCLDEIDRIASAILGAI